MSAGTVRTVEEESNGWDAGTSDLHRNTRDQAGGGRNV
jgi:hypothetical protein